MRKSLYCFSATPRFYGWITYHQFLSLLLAADQPLAAFFHDLIGDERKVKVLVFVVVGEHDTAGAIHEGEVAVGSRLRTGRVLEPRVNRLQ